MDDLEFLLILYLPGVKITNLQPHAQFLHPRNGIQGFLGVRQIIELCPQAPLKTLIHFELDFCNSET